MMFLDRIIRKLGKSDYTLDKNLSSKDILILMREKSFQLLRGYYYKLFIKTDGALFVGRRCKIKYAHKIRAGRTLTIGDQVEINALSVQGIRMGNNVSIHRNSIIECTGVLRHLGEGLSIGNHVGIAQNCFIQVRGKVNIGNHVIMGPGVSIFSENHNFSDPDQYIDLQGETRIGVTIEDGVWLGAGCIILDGVTVGERSIIAAGSVVNKNIPPKSIAAGVPAKVIKTIN